MADDVIISDTIAIPIRDIAFTAVRAQGAGGQNVNKVASAVHLRFDIANCTALPEALRDRLLALKDQRITDKGVLVIKAQEHRTQERNRDAALERLVRIVQSALVEPPARKKTRPGRRAKEQRLEDKRRRSDLKRGRSRISDWTDK